MEDIMSYCKSIRKFDEMPTFLVTGAAGFLGRALVRELLNEKYKVIGIDKKEKGFLDDGVLGDKNFIYFETDIANGSNNRLRNENIDGVFHLASQQPSSCNLSYENFYKGNVETTRNVIDLIREKNIKMVVFTSTITVLGDQPKEKSLFESSAPNPANHYGLTKYLAERLLSIELKDTKTKVVIVRYPSLVGKNHLGGIAHTFYQLAAEGQDIELYGKGEIYRNLLYVKDAVDILVKIIKNVDNLQKFEIFVAGSSDSLKMIEIARKIKELLGSDSNIIPVDEYRGTDGDIFIDNSKAKRMLNFNPMTVEEGLKSYITEMKNEI